MLHSSVPRTGYPTYLHDDNIDVIKRILNVGCTWDGHWTLTIASVWSAATRVTVNGFTVEGFDIENNTMIEGISLSQVMIGEVYLDNDIVEGLFIMDASCQSFAGELLYPESKKGVEVTGVRAHGSECSEKQVTSCTLDYGVGEKQCLFGFWTSFCDNIHCNSGELPHVAQELQYSCSIEEEDISTIQYLVLGVCAGLSIALFVFTYWRDKADAKLEEVWITLSLLSLSLSLSLFLSLFLFLSLCASSIISISLSDAYSFFLLRIIGRRR